MPDLKAPTTPPKWINPFTELTQAVIAVSKTGSELQVADTNATSVMANQLVLIYNTFTPALTSAATAVQTAAATWATDGSNQGYQAAYQEAQSFYSQLNTLSNTATTQGQSAVSADQNQAGQDSSNTARILQLINAVVQIFQTTGRLLGG